MEAKLKRMEENVERLYSRMQEVYSGKNEKYAHICYDQLKKAQQDKTEFSNTLFTAKQEEDYNQSLREQREQKQLENERKKIIARDPNHLHPRNTRVGQSGNHVLGFSDSDYKDQVIDGYKFCNHVIREMRERGLYASQIISTIENGVKKTSNSNPNRWTYYDKNTKVFVVTEKLEKTIVTAMIKTIVDY